MRNLGAIRFPDNILQVPDHTIRLALSTAGTAVDLPDGCNYLRITSLSTAANPAAIHPYLSMGTTRAAIPSTGLSTGSSAAHCRVTQNRMYHTGGSTQISMICEDSSGYASIECWK